MIGFIISITVLLFNFQQDSSSFYAIYKIYCKKYYTCMNNNNANLSTKMLFSVRMSTLYWKRFFDIFHFCFFLASFWTCLTRMSLRSSTRQEHTYSNFRVEKIYIRRWTRERVHECLRNVIPCVLYFLHLTLCPRSSCENNSSHLVIYLFT